MHHWLAVLLGEPSITALPAVTSSAWIVVGDSGSATVVLMNKVNKTVVVGNMNKPHVTAATANKTCKMYKTVVMMMPGTAACLRPAR